MSQDLTQPFSGVENSLNRTVSMELDVGGGVEGSDEEVPLNGDERAPRRRVGKRRGFRLPADVDMRVRKPTLREMNAAHGRQVTSFFRRHNNPRRQKLAKVDVKPVSFVTSEDDDDPDYAWIREARSKLLNSFGEEFTRIERFALSTNVSRQGVLDPHTIRPDAYRPLRVQEFMDTDYPIYNNLWYTDLSQFGRLQRTLLSYWPVDFYRPRFERFCRSENRFVPSMDATEENLVFPNTTISVIPETIKRGSAIVFQKKDFFPPPTSEQIRTGEEFDVDDRLEEVPLVESVLPNHCTCDDLAPERTGIVDDQYEGKKASGGRLDRYFAPILTEEEIALLDMLKQEPLIEDREGLPIETLSSRQRISTLENHIKSALPGATSFYNCAPIDSERNEERLDDLTSVLKSFSSLVSDSWQTLFDHYSRVERRRRRLKREEKARSTGNAASPSDPIHSDSSYPVIRHATASNNMSLDPESIVSAIEDKTSSQFPIASSSVSTVPVVGSGAAAATSSSSSSSHEPGFRMEYSAEESRLREDVANFFRLPTDSVAAVAVGGGGAAASGSLEARALGEEGVRVIGEEDNVRDHEAAAGLWNPDPLPTMMKKQQRGRKRTHSRTEKRGETRDRKRVLDEAVYEALDRGEDEAEEAWTNRLSSLISDSFLPMTVPMGHHHHHHHHHSFLRGDSGDAVADGEEDEGSVPTRWNEIEDGDGDGDGVIGIREMDQLLSSFPESEQVQEIGYEDYVQGEADNVYGRGSEGRFMDRDEDVEESLFGADADTMLGDRKPPKSNAPRAHINQLVESSETYVPPPIKEEKFVLDDLRPLSHAFVVTRPTHDLMVSELFGIMDDLIEGLLDQAKFVDEERALKPSAGRTLGFQGRFYISAFDEMLNLNPPEELRNGVLKKLQLIYENLAFQKLWPRGSSRDKVFPLMRKSPLDIVKKYTTSSSAVPGKIKKYVEERMKWRSFKQFDDDNNDNNAADDERGGEEKKTRKKSIHKGGRQKKAAVGVVDAGVGVGAKATAAVVEPRRSQRAVVKPTAAKKFPEGWERRRKRVAPERIRETRSSARRKRED